MREFTNGIVIIYVKLKNSQINVSDIKTSTKSGNRIRRHSLCCWFGAEPPEEKGAPAPKLEPIGP